jgi:uncharacterized YccA/Bax inhibitor family protein
MARGNPALNLSVYDRAEALGTAEQTMTIQGSALKSAMLVAILVATAALSWGSFTNRSPLVVPMVIGGSLGGMVIALVTVFYPRSSPITAPIYAALEGLVLGAISAIFNAAYPGIVINAVALSIGVLALMLFAYGTRLITATDKFKLAVVSATGAIFLLYLVSFILRLFGVTMPLIHDSGMLGIGFSVVVVIIAAMNLILDFDFIESGVQRQAPAYMEWYAGFGLLVTLVWMYLEILRLLSKLQKK